MKKLILGCFLSIISIQISFAQSSQSFDSQKALSIGLDIGVPSNSIYSIGFGGSAKAEVPVFGPLSLSVTAGFTNMYFKHNVQAAVKRSPDGFAPLKGGAKYYFSPGFYAEGELGAAIRTNHGSGSYFAYAPGIGFAFPLNRNSIDVGIRFEKWTNNHGYTSLSQSGIRVAYKLGW